MAKLPKEKVSIEKVREWLDKTEPIEDMIWTIYEIANGILSVDDLLTEIGYKSRGGK